MTNRSRTIAWTGALIGLAIGTVWLRLSIVRTSYEIDEVDREARARSFEIERLKAEVARLKSPANLKAAADRFGLLPPRTDQVIRVQR